MHIKTYLIERDGKLTREGSELRRIAKFCDVTPYYMYQLASGHKVASPELAANLEYSTNGVVNRRESLPTFPWDVPAKQRRPARKRAA